MEKIKTLLTNLNLYESNIKKCAFLTTSMLSAASSLYLPLYTLFKIKKAPKAYFNDNGNIVVHFECDGEILSFDDQDNKANENSIDRLLKKERLYLIDSSEDLLDTLSQRFRLNEVKDNFEIHCTIKLKDQSYLFTKEILQELKNETIEETLQLIKDKISLIDMQYKNTLVKINDDFCQVVCDKKHFFADTDSSIIGFDILLKPVIKKDHNNIIDRNAFLKNLLTFNFFGNKELMVKTFNYFDDFVIGFKYKKKDIGRFHFPYN